MEGSLVGEGVGALLGRRVGSGKEIVRKRETLLMYISATIFAQAKFTSGRQARWTVSWSSRGPWSCWNQKIYVN